MISDVTRAFIIAFLAAGSVQAAALVPVTAPLIPFAFEENRAIAYSQPQLGNPIVSAFRFAGANTACQATLEQPAQSYSHYYRGTDPAQAQTFLPRYGLLTYHQILPGVDATYSSTGPASGAATTTSGFWMKLQLDSPQRLDAVRLGWNDSDYAVADGTTINSRLGTPRLPDFR